MPDGVVVVQRPRRRLFAILRAAPALLRAVLPRRRPAAPPPPILAAPIGGLVQPALVATPEGGHRCTGCGDCLPVCPPRCLDLAPGDGAPRRFRLDPGACIACGRCIEVCPEAALGAAPAPPVLATTLSGGVPPRDLLAMEVVA